MKITNKQLIGLKVETQSGQKLGTIQSFNIQIDSQSVVEYTIKPEGLIRGLITEELIISRGQVVDISLEKMIVDDNSLTEEIKERIKNPLKKKAVAGALMKKK
ncbi:MAG TPA: PRC-barrel domain-containing protein [bacterium]|nr:PRC-barrel domain-containing protein [bacterium]